MKPPKGFRDLLPDDFKAREYLKRVISDTYEKFGYNPIDTPVVENVEVLLGKGGGENEKLMFRVLKRGRKLDKAIKGENWNELADMGLRYDLTVPLARYYAANRNELPAIFKRYQISPVWRADRPQFGRYREFVQCDVDVIGSDSMLAEVDVICATAECLEKLGFENMKLHLNCRPLVGMLIGKMGVPETLLEDSLRALDKIDRFGIDGAVKEMEEAGTPADACAKVKEFYEKTSGADNVERIALVARQVGKDANKHVKDLIEIIEFCPSLGELEIEIDPFLVRGMDYYTGPIFEIRLPDAGFSIAGGGRYDGLVGSYCKNVEVPATGFSIGFERILVLMKEKEMIPKEWGGLDVVVCADGEGLEKDVMKMATELRSIEKKVNGQKKNLCVDVAVTRSKVGKVLQEAQNRGAKIGVIFKSDMKDEVEIRELAGRKGEQVEKWDVPEKIRAMLKILEINLKSE
ncbi:histidine--tRNA ligase [bacterium]